MIIKANQLEQFNQVKFDEFLVQTTAFLKKNFKDWTTGKTDDDIRKQILDMITWAEAYEIDSGLNIQKLLHHKIEFGWEIPLHEKLEAVLANYKYDQHKRVNNFCLEVESKRYKLIEINLETDLKTIVLK
jgi:hypothetical protein